MFELETNLPYEYHYAVRTPLKSFCLSGSAHCWGAGLDHCGLPQILDAQVLGSQIIARPAPFHPSDWHHAGWTALFCNELTNSQALTSNIIEFLHYFYYWQIRSNNAIILAVLTSLFDQDVDCGSEGNEAMTSRIFTNRGLLESDNTWTRHYVYYSSGRLPLESASFLVFRLLQTTTAPAFGLGWLLLMRYFISVWRFHKNSGTSHSGPIQRRHLRVLFSFTLFVISMNLPIHEVGPLKGPTSKKLESGRSYFYIS